MTLVLGGRYVEAGDHGRFKVEPGDVLVHGEFSSHADWIDAGHDVETCNFELSKVPQLEPICWAPNVDNVARLSKTDPTAAIASLLQSVRPKLSAPADWPEIIARAIRDDPTKPVRHWCNALGLAPSTVSRGFRRAFGVSAAQYRATARARRAYHALTQTDAALVNIADQFQFSDQAHFTRSIRALTGATPNYWRQVKKVQDAERPPN